MINDGSTLWINKNKIINNLNNNSENLNITLIGCDIKSDIVNQSWIIKHNNILYKHFENSNINDWKIKDNIITLFFNSNDPNINLYFFSNGEAALADVRLFLIMNGNIIINCNDQNNYINSNNNNLIINFDE